MPSRVEAPGYRWFAFVTEPHMLATATNVMVRGPEGAPYWQWDKDAETWVENNDLIVYVMGDETRDVVEVDEAWVRRALGPAFSVPELPE